MKVLVVNRHPGQRYEKRQQTKSGACIQQKESPARVARAWEDWFSGYNVDPEDYLLRTFEEVEGYDGIATVADPDGRVLASWGSRRIRQLAEDSNLAPWSTWSEWACGTNGMGTALESHHPVMVRGPEHWCRGFHLWACAGVAVRDVVTDDPLAVLNVSCWKTAAQKATNSCWPQSRKTASTRS